MNDDVSDYLADVTGQVPDASTHPIDVRIINAPAEVQRHATRLVTWTTVGVRNTAIRIASAQRHRTRLTIRWDPNPDITNQVAIGGSDQFGNAYPFGGTPLIDGPNNGATPVITFRGLTYYHTGELWVWTGQLATSTPTLWVEAEYREDLSP